MVRRVMIRPAIGVSRHPENRLLIRGYSVFMNMDGNHSFTFPPVEMNVFKTSLDEYRDAIVASLNRGRKRLPLDG